MTDRLTPATQLAIKAKTPFVPGSTKNRTPPPPARRCLCTNWLGSVSGNAADIKQREALKILGRSTVERQYAFAQERGWRGLELRAAH
jgi:hypothetical protein